MFLRFKAEFHFMICCSPMFFSHIKSNASFVHVWFYKKLLKADTNHLLIGGNNIVSKTTNLIGQDHIKNEKCLHCMLSSQKILQRVWKSIKT